MIEVQNYSKSIKGIEVLSKLNLKFEEGNMYLLKGHNGCGKTMLLRAVCGLIAPTCGMVTYDKEYSFGVVIENPSFMENETGYYNLNYLARINKKIGKERILEMLKKFHLYDAKAKKVKSYSLGMKQRLGLVQAFMENPDVILLDEPFNALDEENFEMVFHFLVEEKKNGKMIIVAAHSLDSERLEVFDQIITMNQGKISEIS